MIEKVEMYSAGCDSCNDTMELFNGVIALNDKSAIEEEVKESGDWVLLRNGKCYCPDCHFTEWGQEEDELLAFTKEGQLLGITE
jgi:hypothetical protein